MIYVKSIFYINYQIIDPVITREVNSQAMLLQQINGKEFGDKKTLKLLEQINEPDG